jgi:hypothetical protein
MEAKGRANHAPANNKMENTDHSHTATEAQTNANRENVQKSTGPKSAEGKDASSRNGLKHGLCANKHILPGEDPEDFLFRLQDLLDRFRPVGPGEEALVLRIAAGQWRLDRAFPMEAGIYRDRVHDVAQKEEFRQQQYTTKKGYAEQDGKPVPPPPTPPDEGDLQARAFNVDCEGPNSFTKLARYESSIERSIDRCLRQLKAFQAARSIPDPSPEGPQYASNPAPEPPSTPSKTEDYKANPKNGGDAQSCTLTGQSFVIFGLLRGGQVENRLPAVVHRGVATCAGSSRRRVDGGTSPADDG